MTAKPPRPTKPDSKKNAVTAKDSAPESAVETEVAAAPDDAPKRPEDPVDQTPSPDADQPDDAAEQALDAESAVDTGDPSPSEDQAAPQTDAPPPSAAAPRGRGLISVLLAGVVAAGLGASAVYLLRLEPPAPDSALLARLEALESAPAPVAAPAVSAEAEAALDALGAENEALRETVSGLQAQVEQLVTEGIAVVSGDEGTIAAAELDRLRAALADQEAQTEALRAELARVTQEASDQVALAEQQAAELKAAAQARATQAARQAALARVIAASETGDPFAEALADLADLGADVSGLTAVADRGIPSLMALQGAFPDAARVALSESVKATMGQGVGDRFSAFLRAQVGARSLEPRAGDDPDAVLSRAEAALRAGNLSGALVELQALPERGQAAMNDWVTMAQDRLQALETLSALTASQAG